ncbi:MAG TPA: hypothetical protein VNT26_08825, partial [Candidatus Sulfotelmatobacter sp.]|nr:hypothetical protein [Candidatus Sulfotelmatobacter sp.]
VLRSDPELFVVPVVILSASQDADDIKRAYQLGAKSYIVKPSDQTGLQAMVKQLHDYWCLCEVPQVDGSGRCLQTQSAGKLGERFI